MIPHAVTRHGLVVRHDSGGDETWQLSLVDAEGVLVPLTHDLRAINGSVHLRPDGEALGLAWNPGGRRDMILGELLLPGGELRTWLEPEGFWLWAAWSPTGERAVVAQSFGGSWVEAHLLDRAGNLTRILPGSRAVRIVEWTTHGLFVVTDDGGDFDGVAEVDPDRPRTIRRWLHRPEHDVVGFTVNPLGRTAAVVVNVGIYDEIRILDLADGAVVDRAGFEAGVVVGDHSGEPGYHIGWSQDGQLLFVSWENPTRPADIRAHPGGERWTVVNGEPPANLVQPIETSYPTFDGLTVPALLYRVDSEPRPTVCHFHGGPEGQVRGSYVPIFHLLTATGINVLAPNVRGSTGYGFRYQSLDDRTLRWNSVKDGCEAARWLKATGQATKVAAMGGSYGGFMTLAAIVDDPGLWDAAVDIVGIARWRTFFDNMPPWRGVLRMREYGDPYGAEAEFLESISPIHRAADIRAPLLVVHGRNDPRVPVSESEQIAEAASDSELLIFDDEGHGIARHANQVIYNRRVLDFLTKRLS